MKKARIIIFILSTFFLAILSIQNESIAEVTERQYCIDLEWGSLSFVYDKGTWDTENLTYRKQESSSFPAKETQDGKPGWYGFNGEANKITLHNASEQNEITANIEISTELKDTEGALLENQPTYNEDLSFSIYKDNNWTCFDGYTEETSTTMTQKVSPGDSIDFFISIAGKLKETSEIARSIGNVTIVVSQ